MVGDFTSIVTFAPGALSQTQIEASGTGGNGFVARYAASGALVRAETIAGPATSAPAAADFPTACSGRCKAPPADPPAARAAGTRGASLRRALLALLAGCAGNATRPHQQDAGRGASGPERDAGRTAESGPERPSDLGTAIEGGGFDAAPGAMCTGLPKNPCDEETAHPEACAPGCGGTGTLMWAAPVAAVYVEDVAAGPDSSVVVVGYMGVTATFGEGTPAETTLTSAGGSDILVAKYAFDGRLLWAKHAGGMREDQGWGVATGCDGSVLVAADIRGAATFGEGDPTETTVSGVMSGGLAYPTKALAKYAPDGTLAWVRATGAADDNHVPAVAATADGGALLTGEFGGSAWFGAGEPGATTLDSAGREDLFVARYSAEGALMWAKRAGGLGPDSGGEIAVHADDEFALTGWFQWYPATFGSGEPDETTLVPGGGVEGGREFFVARYRGDGTLAWARRAGGEWDEMGGPVAAATDGGTLVAGGFSRVATFGPGEAGERILDSAGGAFDVFVARYQPDGELVWARRAGGTELDIAQGLAAVGGGFRVAGVFGAVFGTDDPSEPTLTTSGGTDLFVARFDENGALCWARAAGGPQDQVSVGGLALGADGTEFVAGTVVGEATFGRGEPQETTMGADRQGTGFLARFAP